MRYLYSALLVLVISCSAVADPSIELKPENQRLANMLLSGDLKEIKAAAKAINSNEISDPALLDIAAEALLRKYSHVTSAEVDTFAWVARAIGASENARYYDTLQEVVDKASDKKLIKHAERALNDIGDKAGTQYVTGTYQLPKGLYEKEDDATRDQRVMALIMSGSLSSLKEAARAIVDTKAQNVVLTDMVAEVLATYYANASDDQIDTLSWIATALGQSESGRYVDLLNEVEENGSHRKLRKYADKALDAHGDAKGKQYQKGMLGKAIPQYLF